ncbi:divergent protein kinase domain 1C [Onthophagus taurus]|uniref:divergent protein kinase domain 1C n=1 Tax=Onthophagus taurus TaxID=166361 RepID=UPI0039BE6B1E
MRMRDWKIFFRRLRRISYKLRFHFYIAVIITCVLLYFVYKWNYICIFIEAPLQINAVCDLFLKDLAIGSLCIPLCTTKEVKTISCENFLSNKLSVFTIEWHETKMVFKKITSNPSSIHWYDNGKLKYPSEKDFLRTIQAIVYNKLNFNITIQSANKLSRLKPNYQEINLGRRQKEIDILWRLLQDNEYLISSLYIERDVFPQLIGTCGVYYAVEELDPILDTSSMWTIKYDKQDWGARLKTALLIIELLDELENGFHEHYHLCDIRTEHFGFTKSRTKIKFLDLMSVHPKSIVSGYLQTSISSCRDDSDCEYLDCRGRCNLLTKKCTQVTNNNLQIVCEKIFLGWRMSKTILVPGLLMVPHTPSELAAILRQCSNPDMELGKPRTAASEDIKKRLYNTLIEMEEVVNGEME